MTAIAQETLGIAVVDDDDVYRAYLSQLLAKSSRFTVFEACSGEALDKILTTEVVDCIVLDYNLGTESGFAINDRLIKNRAVVPPIVMITGDGRESTVIKALRLGLKDYLPKRGLDSASLVGAIGRVVLDDRKMMLEKAEYARLQKAADLDFTTGLPARAQLESRMAQIASLPVGSRAAYTLILIELIEFDDIVAQFGLTCGNQALRAFSDRLRAVCRATEICGRYCDNAFLVIVDVSGDDEQIKDISRRIADGLTFNIDLNATSLQLSARVGHASYDKIGQAAILTPADLLDTVRATMRAKGSTEAESACIDAACVVTAGGAHVEAPRTSDRRRWPRQRVLKRGQIVMPKGLIDCMVRNVSTNGAGLRINALFAVPREFDLVVPADGTRRRTRVCWQIGTNLGVEYVRKVDG